MKSCYFLDKIHNVNFREFDKIIKTIVDELNQKEYAFSFFKSQEKWIIEIEQSERILIVFDDYTMFIKNGLKGEVQNYSKFWQNIFYKFLRSGQKKEFVKNIDNQIEDKKIIDKQREAINNMYY